MMSKWAVGLFLLGLVLPAPALAQDDFGERIRDYLLQNPDIVIEILQNAERHYDEQAQLRQRTLLQENREALERAGVGGFVFGNPSGDITLVEFFDYQCRFCKATFSEMIDAVQADGGVRLVLREMPVFGEISLMAAKAALAAEKQRLYFELHAALMAQQDAALSEAKIFSLAEQVGLDTARLRIDMERPEILVAIEANLALAARIGVRGTPGFVDRHQITTGALERDEFHILFARIREDALRPSP